MEPDGENARKVQQAIENKAHEKWGKDKAKKVLNKVKNDPHKMCFLDGSNMADYDGFEGNVFLRAHENDTKPTTVDNVKDPVTGELQKITSGDGKLYAGCYVNALVEFWMQDNQYGQGIRAYLKGVQFAGDGEAFSGGKPASADEFDDLASGVDAPELGSEEDDDSLLG
jgi:hypothetical protein